MKLLTIVGARPQFIKAAAVEQAVREAAAAGAALRSVLVNTGQHYDFDLSTVFFEELGLQNPDYNLGVGSASHGAQTGRMLEAVESVLLQEVPDWVLVYGDTNSTIAGALAAAKLHVPVAHVEAGLRSFNRRMPEEVNRVLTDHLSQRLFCPTQTAVDNLTREGISGGVTVVGDVMYELVTRYAPKALFPPAWADMGLEAGRYVLATVHRAENTDDATRLGNILEALSRLSSHMPVVVPLHPRTQKFLAKTTLELPNSLKIVGPLSYGSMIASQHRAALVVTDSGGVQKEAFWLGVPCVTLRDETEWLETLEEGRNIIVGADRDRIVDSALAQLARGRFEPPAVQLDSAASEIVRTLLAG